MSNEQKDDLIGKSLGQYTIMEEIGRGGMATVYSARQRSMGRIVAVKVLPRHLLHDPGFLERFEREVEVISHLEHPHILPIYDYGESDGVPYIAMRYLGGGSMAQMVRRGVPDLDDLERPFSQICQALDYAHRQGVIHRDLKPGNIMLDESGNAYLSDFGIARVMGSNLTGSAIIGTPAYMSPEQANGFPIDARSDIYSLGVVLFELITGREPYQAETPMALLLKHINEPMPPLRDFREGVPGGLEDVIAKATEKDPDDRYTSAGEMAKAVGVGLRTSESTRASVGTRPVKQAPPPPAVETAHTTPGVPLEGATLPEAALGRDPTYAAPAPQRKTSPLGFIAGLVVIVAIIAGAVLVLPGLMGGSDTDTGNQTANAVPTAFRRGAVIRHASYTLSMPETWIPQLTDFNDLSDATRLWHVWVPNDNSSFVTLALVDQADMTVDEYHAAYYEPHEDDMVFIDESIAPDSTIRRSYRVESWEIDEFSFDSGQIDVFYMERSNKLVVLEMYTADSIGSDVARINTLQLILDSLRVKAPGQAG